MFLNTLSGIYRKVRYSFDLIPAAFAFATQCGTAKYSEMFRKICADGRIESLPDCKKSCDDGGTRNSAATALVRAMPSIDVSGRFHNEMASRNYVNVAYRCPNETVPSSLFFKRSLGFAPDGKFTGGDVFLYNRYIENGFLEAQNTEDKFEPLFRF